MGVAFFLGAAFFAAGLAAVFVTRPDLVLVSTLGTSTTAGAAVEVLRGLAVFALGLAAAFLVVVAFFAGLAATVFLTVVFLGAAGLAAAGFYFRLVLIKEIYWIGEVEHTLATGLGAASFLASFTGPEGPETC